MQEAGFSETVKLYNSEGAERMVTFRGESFDEWGKVEKEISTYLDEKKKTGWTLTRQPAPRQAGSTPQQQPSQQQARTVQPQQVSDSAHTFHATKLSIQFSPKGLKMGKLHGGNYQKYGVTVWPEVALELGFGDLNAIQPGEYPCDLMVAYSVNDEGKPQKVIGLASNSQSQTRAAVAGEQQASHQAHGFGGSDEDQSVPF